MKKTIILIACTLFFSLTSFAHTRDFQTAKLVDVTYDDVLHGGSSQRHPIYKINLDDMLYSAEGDKVKHNADPAHGLVVVDEVRVAIEGDRLYLRRADGKYIKANIVKRQRAEGFLGRWFSKK
jgi:hypothetical protein